jgi:predicted TIM-barrel fold metal-dependent hydrolase
MPQLSEKGFPFVIYDAHHHLWDLEAVHYPWLAAKGVQRFFGNPTAIQKNYLPEDLRTDIGDLPVEKSVHIQVGAADNQHVAETAWLQKMCDHHGLPNAIVAYCALEQGNRTEILDQLQQFQAMRGIRQIVGRSPEEDKRSETGSLLENPEWIIGLKELAKRKLTFDLQLIPCQMEAAFKVFSQVEDLPVTLCHCGSPGHLKDKANWNLWQQGLQKLAQLPNFHCKISGLGMFDHDWTTDSLRPIVETVIEISGPERCMFGSNFPVDKLHRDYQSLWQSYLQLCTAMTQAEQRQLFQVNCQHFYKI